MTGIIKANLVDIVNRRIHPAEVEYADGIIQTISEIKSAEGYILPGFIDAHIHIESSMLIPAEFARMAVRHGTVATVSDPHEIGNVLGIKGVEFMIENGNTVPFKFYFGAPSCVPATPFETSGAEITTSDIAELMGRDEIKYLSEMMNWPGVLHDDPTVYEKIEVAKSHGKPIDGHAPGLMGAEALKYISAGISTDHECFTYQEALDKIKGGMKVIIREGSAARNYEALHPLISEYPDKLMFCSDDKHPDELLINHIDELVRRSIRNGHDLYDVLNIACLNPIEHYGLEVGQLRPGDTADFILVDDLEQFGVQQTYIDGVQVSNNGESRFTTVHSAPLNNFNVSEISASDLKVKAKSNQVRVIEALDGQLITNELQGQLPENNGILLSDSSQDILKMVVVNRYNEAPPSVAFIKGFGFKSGAIASSVGHDSHNITAVGVDDESIAKAVNLIIRNQGGLSVVGKGREEIIPLPFAGLMTNLPGEEVASAYTALDTFAKSLGSPLRAPFMTLSFMALLVIPDLKLSDKGLFSGAAFEFRDLYL